jgi:hypothetical protein
MDEENKFNTYSSNSTRANTEELGKLQFNGKE